MTVALTALATVAVPLLSGAALGLSARRLWGYALRGVVAVLVALVLPTAAAVALVARGPVIGLWDAVVAGFLFGAGIVLGAHAALRTPGRIESIALGTLVGLIVVELGTRAFLPPPPRFPSAAGIHLWLVDSIRASRETQGWDMRSRELACGIVYGEAYRGVLAVSGETDVGLPGRYTPRPDARRRELHVGDSMVFGLGVERADTFTAALDALDTATEHVNAGIPGLAPDAYLAVLETWIARQRFDAVTMYIFDSNDVRDLDGPFPCCGFAPLLTYDTSTARLRCPSPTPIDLGSAGFEWLLYNSPPPYVVRALTDYVAAAGWVGAVLVDVGHRYSLTPASTPSERIQHLGLILRTARDELASRGTAFRVVILPGHVAASDDASRDTAGERGQMIALARDLEIPFLDAAPMLRAALLDGRDLVVRPFDPHFNRDGHRLIAEWLHRAWTGQTADL